MRWHLAHAFARGVREGVYEAGGAPELARDYHVPLWFADWFEDADDYGMFSLEAAFRQFFPREVIRRDRDRLAGGQDG